MDDSKEHEVDTPGWNFAMLWAVLGVGALPKPLRAKLILGCQYLHCWEWEEIPPCQSGWISAELPGNSSLSTDLVQGPCKSQGPGSGMATKIFSWGVALNIFRGVEGIFPFYPCFSSLKILNFLGVECLSHGASHALRERHPSPVCSRNNLGEFFIKPPKEIIKNSLILQYLGKYSTSHTSQWCKLVAHGNPDVTAWESACLWTYKCHFFKLKFLFFLKN